jgi:hypothetical protein
VIGPLALADLWMSMLGYRTSVIIIRPPLFKPALLWRHPFLPAFEVEL